MKKLVLLSKIVFSLAALALLCFGCNGNKDTGEVPQITIGIQNSPSNSLVILAAEKHFFDTTKVKVVIQNFTAGKLALQALLGNTGDVDIAVCAETPIVLSSLGGNKLKVISQIVDAKNECRVVVRKDGDKVTPENYFSTKRKIATSQGGSPEWLTYKFINKYNLDKGKIEIVAMQPQDMPLALSNGAVDAISIFDPFARLAEKQLGDKGLTFFNTDISSYYVLGVKESVFAKKKELFLEVLKGLIKASDFIKSNADEAKQIIAKHTNLDINIINETWNNYNFGIGLSNDLLSLCNDEAKWAIETAKYPQGTSLPDFKNILSSESLKQLAPSSVEVK